MRIYEKRWKTKRVTETARKKICFIATLELSVKVFLTQHMRVLQDHFDVSLIVNTHNTAFLDPYNLKVSIIPVDLQREISPLKDLKSLFDLIRIFRRERFSIIHSIMPKSGLLSMLAGYIARVPVRMHTFTGQLWKNYTGFPRFFFKGMDRLIAACATRILVDSPSQREYIIKEGIVSHEKSAVIGDGSICGVDVGRFGFDRGARGEMRSSLSFGDDDVVFIYLGRLKKDKGILDLAHAFSLLSSRYPKARLLVVGPDEEGMLDRMRGICVKYPDRLRVAGFTDNPEKYLSAADILCLPSYREGFGQVIAEAAAAGIPAIGSRIYGITDIIEDGATGFLFEPGAYHDLMQKMSRFLDDPALIRKMGDRARDQVKKKFSQEKVTSAMAQFYREIERSL
ncbi:MAG: glycosyltransferase family 4 protein [Syntrophorhabdaceae bacterium]